MSPPSGTGRGQLIDLATLQTGSEMRHYFLAVQREPDGQLELEFLVATDMGLAPAAELEGATLTLLVAEKGRESWNAHTIELSRRTQLEPERGVFRGRLPERVQATDITAVIPKLRIGGQRLLASFTIPATAAAEE